jgi:hypothetical protein
MTEDLKEKLIIFFENTVQFYGQKITVESAISNNGLNFNRHFTSFSFNEFVLNKISTLFSGGRATFEGNRIYFEIAIDHLISFEEVNKNESEFMEKLSDKVFIKTRIKFIKKEI